MVTTIRRMGFFQWLAYTVHHTGGLLEDDWDEHVDTSPWFGRDRYGSSNSEDEPKKHKTRPKTHLSEPTEEPVKDKDHSNKGIMCRGVWIDLSEDEDGCWINTPYYVSIKADSFHPDTEGIHRCQTMNDVNSAAALGLLFPTRIGALSFITNLQQQNELLNKEAENVRSQS